MVKKPSKNGKKVGLLNSNLVPGTSKTAFNAKLDPLFQTDSFGVVNGVVSFEDYQKALMKRKPYKSFTIVRCTPTEKHPLGEWYVEYRYEVPGKPFTYKPVKKRGDLNSITDPVQRERAAQQLQRDIISWLDAGNMPPFALKVLAENTLLNTTHEIFAAAEKPKNWTMAIAIDQYRKFIAAHNYAPRTLSTYKCYVDDLADWLADARLLETTAYKFTELDLMSILDEVYEELEWSPRTYNNNFEFFGTFFNRCQKLEKQKFDRKVQYDFDIELVDMKLTTPQRNKAYPPIIAKRVKEHLGLPGNEVLRDYIEWIFLSLMRPKEIRSLKIEHLDIESRQIRIIGKTGDRIIPLSDQLVSLINRKKLLEMDPECYIFGRALEVNKDPCGINYPLEKYNVIKVKLRLDVNYKPYSWKHTGVINMINAGFSDKEIMVLTGHKTQAAFEAYKRDLVIENGHAMKGSTVDF